MSTLGANSIMAFGNSLGTPLTELLMANAIEPGAAPSYQLCKTIYLYHPLGKKIAESPIEMAHSQEREINIPKGPEERVRKAFLDKWHEFGINGHIFNVASQTRVYGIASIAMLIDGYPTDKPVDMTTLSRRNVTFNTFDPLNTSGSLVLNQIPNASDFQKVKNIRVQGEVYHSSRICVMMNERPIYISYTPSAFGFVGRSVFQRSLYMLKSFVNTMVTDDLVAKKAGLIVAKMKQPGSIIDAVMQSAAALKRTLLQQAQVGNVMSIQPEEDIESINMQNLEGPYTLVRKNILENIAAADGMPAKLLLNETFAEGFGEGTEDAKYIAQYIERFRQWLSPLYDYFDDIVQRLAWTPEFFELIKEEFPEYKGMTFNRAFYEWRNSFSATWPSLIREPESELIKVAEVKLKAIIALLEVLLPILDAENKAIVLEWAADNFNELNELFDTPLDLDADAILSGLEEKEEQDREAHENQIAGGANGLQEPKPPKPFSAQDSEVVSINSPRVRRAIASLESAMGDLHSFAKAKAKRHDRESRIN
jgi:hypothetical protein